MKNKQKDLSSLKNKHINSDIYIICSGKSLDFFDLSFFNDKITIGVNQTFLKIKTDYIIKKDFNYIEDALKTNSEIICSQYEYGGDNNMCIFNDVFVFKHKKNKLKLIDLNLSDDEIIVSYSTVTSAMHIAAYMGAKTIILVGHDCGTINGETNFNGYSNDIKKTPWGDWSQYKDWLKTIEAQTIDTKTYLINKYGVVIFSLNPFVSLNLEGNKYE